jgi:hypothetical protein
MVMSRTTPSYSRPTDPTVWRRPRQRQVVLAAVAALALLTGAQSFAGESTLQVADEEGRGPLVSNSEPVDVAMALTVPSPPLAPPALPEPEPVQVQPPAEQVQTDPAPVPQQPMPDPEVATVDLAPVLAQSVRIRLQQSATMVDDPVSQALSVPGVTFATAVAVGELPVTSEKGTAAVRVAAVDPNGFRILTPQVTADAVEVWQRIAEGDAAFTHDVGTRLALELGSRVPTGDGEGSTLRIGAYASNGVPPIADAVISRSTAEELGLRGRTTLLISIAEGADPAGIATALADATGMQPDVVAEPETRRAFLTGAAARSAFEPFSYVSIGDGMIQIDRDWTSRNIVSAQVPIFRGNVICHRLLVPQLRGALQEVEAQGLADLIDPSQYGGCWVPRHILFNPNRGLSMHAWGLAVDFNVRGNEYGNRNPQMDPRIVEIFERWGFVWGGRWSTPDGMHFELGALLDGSGR